jgi:hypothetical protein
VNNHGHAVNSGVGAHSRLYSPKSNSGKLFTEGWGNRDSQHSGAIRGLALVLAADTDLLELIRLENEKDLAHMNAAAAKGVK